MPGSGFSELHVWAAMFCQAHEETVSEVSISYIWTQLLSYVPCSCNRLAQCRQTTIHLSSWTNQSSCGVFWATSARELNLFACSHENKLTPTLTCAITQMYVHMYFTTMSSIEHVNSLREVQALKRLNPHPNILQLFEVV